MLAETKEVLIVEVPADGSPSTCYKTSFTSFRIYAGDTHPGLELIQSEIELLNAMHISVEEDYEQ